MQLSVQQINSVLCAVLISVLPTLLLTEIGHSSTVWYLLVVSSFVIWFTRSGGISITLASLRPYRPLIYALFYSFVPIIIFMIAKTEMAGAELERTARIVLGCIFVLGAILSMRPQYLRQASWGLAVAGLASSAYVFWPAERELGRPVTPEFNAVSYGNLILLVAVLLIYSTGWSLSRWGRGERAVKWIAAAITLVAFVLTETRTGWLAIPVFGLIWMYTKGWIRRSVTMIYTAVGLILVCAVMVLSIPKLHTRITDGAHEVAECFTTNATAFTSTCIRVQLWRSSMDMFVEHPWLGLGLRKNFQPALQERVSKGIVSQQVADGWAEPHNDMMMALATQGLLGGLGLLLVYFAPALLFVRRLEKDQCMNARVAAAMGLAVCLGFAIFGLSELMFRGMRTVGFYAILVGWLLALSDPILNRDD